MIWWNVLGQGGQGRGQRYEEGGFIAMWVFCRDCRIKECT